MSGLGQNISRRRSKFPVSATDLSASSGISPDRLAAIEGGMSPSTVELDALARALEIDPAALYRGEVDAPPARSAVRFRAPLGVASLDERDTRLLAKGAEIGRA